jgi:hypothetical protein
MEIRKNNWYKFATFNGILLEVREYFGLGWCYRTKDCSYAESNGFFTIEDSDYYLLPIKDIAHTRGFYSDVYCKYKGNELAIDSCYNSSFNVAPCTLEVALAVGFTAEKFNYEYAQMNVQITEIDEIYRRREKLGDFIFDVDPIKPIYKDGKWLIEPDENGVYVI